MRFPFPGLLQIARTRSSAEIAHYRESQVLLQEGRKQNQEGWRSLSVEGLR